MTVVYWQHATRQDLTTVLPEALVVWPIGATEQHGPHLATGTDALIAARVVELAVARIPGTEHIVVAPPLPFGASDHHHPFGGTLSLSGPVALQVFGDILRSMRTAGARRVAIINGHGGNTAAAGAAAADVAASTDLQIALIDYWTLIPVEPGDPPIPGHAGAFETSVISAIDDRLVAGTVRRPPPAPTYPAGVQIHARSMWQQMDGFGDDPTLFDRDSGARWLETAAERLAAALVELSSAPQ